MREIEFNARARQIVLAYERELLLIVAQVEQAEKIEAQKRRGYQL